MVWGVTLNRRDSSAEDRPLKRSSVAMMVNCMVVTPWGLSASSQRLRMS